MQDLAVTRLSLILEPLGYTHLENI